VSTWGISIAYTFSTYGHDRSICGLLAPGEVVLSRTRDGALSLRSLNRALALEARFEIGSTKPIGSLFF
jgi:hypothetical protein